MFHLEDPCFLFDSAGHHLIKVKATEEKEVLPVTDIREKLYIGSKYVECVVCRMPNLYGHGVIN